MASSVAARWRLRPPFPRQPPSCEHPKQSPAPPPPPPPNRNPRCPPSPRLNREETRRPPTHAPPSFPSVGLASALLFLLLLLLRRPVGLFPAERGLTHRPWRSASEVNRRRRETERAGENARGLVLWGKESKAGRSTTTTEARKGGRGREKKKRRAEEPQAGPVDQASLLPFPSR